MAKPAGSLDDDIFGDSLTIEQPKRKVKPRGRQEDGTYITSTGEVLPAKNRERRIPYDEPLKAQSPGHEEIVQTPDGKVSFQAARMNDTEFRKAGFPNRKRLDCRYVVIEVYAGQPRKHYSYDELEQLRRGELKR